VVAKHDRPLGLSILDEIFRTGQPPHPLPDGRFSGQLLALEVGAGVTPVLSGLTDRWMPWRGKTFDAPHSRGDNIFTRDSMAFARLFNPGYKGFVDDGPERYRAFAFHTHVGAGLEDPDRQVLKIDYDLAENPQLVRRVLDELVQIDEATYLGKAHLKVWRGEWRRVAFFSLLGGG
jgi:hypothetical protein